MIDWSYVVAHGLWILGLSIALAVVSWTGGRRMGPCPVKSSSIAGLIVRAELPLVMAMSPLLLFPTQGRLLVLLIIPILWACGHLATGRAIPSTPINYALFMLLAMVGVSLWATFDVTFSLGKVSGVIIGAILYWAVVRWIANPGRLRLAVGAFLLCGGALAVVGMFGAQWRLDKFPMFAPMIRLLPTTIRGVPGAADGFNANAVAGMLLLFIPLQAALLATTMRGEASPWLTSQRTLATAGQVLLFLLTGGMLVLLQSRGAWVGLLVAALAFMLWYRRWTRMVTLAGLVAAVVGLLLSGPESLSELLAYSPGSDVEGFAARVELWSRGIYAIRDHPFTGMGMNVFRKALPTLYPTFSMPATVDVAHAHNHFLQAALDLGIPGLVAYTSIWILTAWSLVGSYRGTGDPFTRAVAGGLGAGLLAHFVFSMTDAIPLGAKVGVLFWFALALALSLRSLTAGLSPELAERPAP